MLVNQINISGPHLGLGNYDITPWGMFVSKKALKPTMTQTSALHQNASKVQKLSLIYLFIGLKFEKLEKKHIKLKLVLAEKRE